MLNAEWPGILDPEVLNPTHLDDGERLADAAKAGDWAAVLGLLDAGRPTVNQWRIGGQSWFTPLHQAAFLGAPVDVVEELVRRGAWRSLPTADGDRPIDLAERNGHHHLREALATHTPSDQERRRFAAWDRHLAALIAERTERLDPVGFRAVPTEVIALETFETLWFGYPGMYGGFGMSIHRGRLFVESWSRVVGGSGQAHVITESGCVLVEEGFV
ncbi:hypothetical protein DY023_13845 [Microbacterium bovistercoris]|uniref:Uncharacterized protein n=1 Tax=Microbacterium bovistercoris TaxID=2293570 RepID=A0A371NQP6_9MICO|nr:hypothetical protein [Microbacterium bovistercoris]REJ04524.1 hypothetical protein DY023_13845 [Microbacterium bovistercoris]